MQLQKETSFDFWKSPIKKQAMKWSQLFLIRMTLLSFDVVAAGLIITSLVYSHYIALAIPLVLSTSLLMNKLYEENRLFKE